ncbi:Hypothetical protein ORPV_914 [Orpheovirus IHUMI-LCC2]|uniref:Uncharacterized protein n=1 Tax=Orpheovirus IHUMI-LCC2 TaxID=2023057 RepID=A0A2I2L5J0_9VIRU|nr:Hypothetical protein ORPV_914 [Orpheovirus IHUMI-LCC2]SNW62818.1 Hypothetical protein ORPV_914 [Orpheovirus IHUMI-LCC2]
MSNKLIVDFENFGLTATETCNIVTHIADLITKRSYIQALEYINKLYSSPSLHPSDIPFLNGLKIITKYHYGVLDNVEIDKWNYILDKHTMSWEDIALYKNDSGLVCAILHINGYLHIHELSIPL